MVRFLVLLDWDDMDAFKRAFQSPEGRAAAQDVPKFAPSGVRSMVFDLEDL